MCGAMPIGGGFNLANAGGNQDMPIGDAHTAMVKLVLPDRGDFHGQTYLLKCTIQGPCEQLCQQQRHAEDEGIHAR